MDLTAYRQSPRERERTKDLFKLIPPSGDRALDVGARDGHMARLLAERYREVTALDLEKPEIDQIGIVPVQGNAVSLPFDDNWFDLVLCAEVLEHIPNPDLSTVCQELQRVCRGSIVIGVPYLQDLRFGQTTCSSCGAINPPWGHVNTFSEQTLRQLFADFRLGQFSFVAISRERTNPLSAALMTYAGNPYGTYEQDEACIKCGRSVGQPSPRNITQKIATKIAFTLNDLQAQLTSPRPNWIHALFHRR